MFLRFTKSALLAFLLLNVIFSTSAGAQKVVRVGWYDSPFNYQDSFGRRAGYAYEYQQKVAAYTGWTYEYVNATWPELLDMLRTGEIDLMSDVSYTNERAAQMLFSTLPMGAETYYIFTTTDNAGIALSNIAYLNGKRIGVNRNSIQKNLFINWAAANGINVEIVELSLLEKDAFQMLKRGDIDAYITLDAYENEDPHSFVPILKIGESDYFFAINRFRPDLQIELNNAMSKIYDENRFYNQQLHEKYLASIGTNTFLSNDTVNWLNEHGAIRVGYLDNYLPFCTISFNGVRGVLNDYLTLAKDCTKNAKLNFETAAYPNLDAALEALRAGDIDCVFPVNISAYDGEQMGIMATTPIVPTEMYLVVNRGSQNKISANQNLVIAVNNLNLNHMTFLRDNFPNWTVLNCNGIEECFSAVESGEANGAIISNYRVVQNEKLLQKYDLLSLSTGKSIDFAFAVRRSDSELYHILNKTASLVPHVSINSALTQYSYPDGSFSLIDFLRRNWLIVILLIVAAAVLAIMSRERRAKLREKDLAERIEVQNQLLENERKMREVDSMITAVAADYRSVYYVNLDNDYGVCYRAKTTSSNKTSDLPDIKKGDHFPFRERFLQYANAFVAEPYRADFLNFIEPGNIRAKLEHEIITAHRYLTIRDGVEYYEMLRIVNLNPVNNQRSQDIHSVSVGFADVDSETRETLMKNRALSDALKQAEAANAVKSSFLSSVSHEIRTPMNAIIGLSNLALNDSKIPASTRDYLEKIDSSSKHLMHLINDVLDMNRIDSGKMTVHDEEFDFREMLKQINTIIQEQCQEKNLKYDFRVIGGVDDYYIGDAIKLRQVLINILGNAVKYTPAPGTVSFIVELLTKYEDYASLHFTIKDTGVGMDAKFLPKIFEPFSQEDENKANKYGSTGLGMAITKNIVDMMNGKIEVDSEKGVGSTFTVTVSLKILDKSATVAEEDIQPEEIIQAEPQAADLTGKRVLIAEDMLVNAEILKEILTMREMKVEHAENGQIAVDMFAKSEPNYYDAILMDIRMPVMDGLTATETIRALDRPDAKKIPIIAVTANAFEEDVQRSLQAGMNAHLSKPVEPERLFETLETFILKA